ncbi:type II toxin-antitoxin system RelE/ParE family toxin [Thiohalophilus sp.]|uniref:type II toxin-antitoxin system RelE/ParE family toxin n=1 Tax=Thiohalophilus sp. TaxID=3028392 RepID=UPI002ACE9095|nr:type II toxin-antitoxin system RelE/ParE family toxin [Thiohalophilus sp.]MDZ7804421.1 type II toxin-antitoxin system RelE/ParE family toxin [Thiohalophilus sp.]
MPELEWLELARADLLSIVDYISDDNPDAAQHVKDDIEAKLKSCQTFRNRTPRQSRGGTRELVAWANYIIVYEEDAFTVRILRVLHAAQQWPSSS